MTFRNGFIIGVIAGFVLIGATLGYGNPSPEAQHTASAIGKTALLVACVITVIKPFKRGSVINPTADGLLSGFGFSAGLTSIVLFGVSFP